MVRKSLVTGLAMFALALSLATSQAVAQDKPFKIRGGGYGPLGIPLPGAPSKPHWAVGNATHLGKYYGEGRVQTDPVYQVDPQTGVITGTFGSALDPPTPFVFTGANGDNLTCFYGRTEFDAKTPGTYRLVPVSGQPGWYVSYWIAEFVPYGPECTGKFQGVTGSWIMYAQSEPFEPFTANPIPVAYTWEGEGTLHFSKNH